MSQFKIGADAQYPLDAFATLVVASTVGYVPGEAVYQGASLAAATASAKVSRVVDATHLAVKAVKGEFAASTATVGNKSTTSSNTAASSFFSWGVTRSRMRDGVATNVVAGAITVDDRGISQNPWSDGAHLSEVVVAARLAASKMQDTDTTVVPVLVYTIPAAGTYGDGDVMEFTITSNEALSVAGAPRVAINTLGDAETVYATYNSAKSSSMKLVFEYAVDEATTTAGQIASVAYDANSAVVTDIGGAAVTPDFGSPTLTGILIA